MAINGTWFDGFGNTLTLHDGGNGTLSGDYATVPISGTYNITVGIPVPLGWSFAPGGGNVTMCGLLNLDGTMEVTYVTVVPGNPVSTGQDAFTQARPSQAHIDAHAKSHKNPLKVSAKN
jgi:hypothetical protein